MSSAPHALSLELREPHLDADAGLEAIPPAVRGITFDFDGFSVTSSRRFTHAQKCIILWSPNSYQEPLCPGAPLSGLPPLQPSRELRRRDGSRGRYDCFVIPQLVSNVHPYLALVHRASRVPTTDEWHPAYGFPAQFWEDVPGRLDATTGNVLGRMSLNWRTLIRKLAEGLQRDIQAWIGTHRHLDKVRLSNLPHTLGIPPKLDTARLAFLLDRLEEGCSWDDGLERAVELQYDLRQRRAWFIWAQGCMAETRSCTELRRTMRLPADDDYVGFWVNGCSEETTMLLMSLGAPAFVIHTRPIQDQDVVEQPSAWLQSSTTFNEYFFLHASSAIIGPSIPTEMVPPATWPYPAFPLHGQRGNTSPSRALNPTATTSTRTPPTLPSPAPVPPMSYIHDDPEPISTAEGRAVTPEPLIEAEPGKWTHWKEMDDPDVDRAAFFASTSKTAVEFDGQRVVYDRQNRRQILLDDLVYPAGTTDPELYGFRLPERVFRQRRNQGWKIVHPSSKWAYHSMHVPKESRHRIGTLPVQPQAQVPAPSRKGKQAVRVPLPPRSKSPSEVSLGSPEREEPEPRVFPTRCLRVDNLELSAVNLAALARNDQDLERAGVFLKEIIVGQGATWMRFDDDESPGLIWTWLERLHQDVRVEVASREAFNEASLYSHDRWDGSSQQRLSLIEHRWLLKSSGLGDGTDSLDTTSQPGGQETVGVIQPTDGALQVGEVLLPQEERMIDTSLNTRPLVSAQCPRVLAPVPALQVQERVKIPRRGDAAGPRGTRERPALVRAPRGPECVEILHRGDTDALVASPRDAEHSDQDLSVGPDRPGVAIKARVVSVAEVPVDPAGHELLRPKPSKDAGAAV
ncbi:hypothetical protein C8F01DRAFT_1248754 [Mycena amicta]|nr:hypothetical protein C8F01DRAFT_1248754 [Mycena amicta]